MLWLQLKGKRTIALIVAIALTMSILSACAGRKTVTISPENHFDFYERITYLEVASEYFIEANTSLRKGDTLLALRYLETAFMLDTASEILPERIIDIALTAGFPASAVRTIQRGRNFPELEDSELRRLAAIFLRFRSYPQAFEAVSAIKEKSRSDTLFLARMSMAENLAILGAFYNMKEEYDSSLMAFNKVLELGVKTPEILFGIGVASERTGNYIAAERYFREVLTMDPRHALAANYLGYMWAERGVNLDEAMKLILIALEVEPDNGAYLDSYGWVLFQMGRYEEALPPLLRSAELIDDDYVVFYHLGEVYLKLGDKENALKFYIKANTFKDNPDFEKIAEIISSLSE
jgi:tetratricopeptide (TPR) repeat protein